MYTYLGKWIMVNNNKCECTSVAIYHVKSPKIIFPFFRRLKGLLLLVLVKNI